MSLLSAPAFATFAVLFALLPFAADCRADGDRLQPLTRLRHLAIDGRPIPLTPMQARLDERWR